MSVKLSAEEIKNHSVAFWVSLERQWDTIHKAILEGTDGDRQRVLHLLHYFAGPLTDYIDFEITIGEYNRVVFDASKDAVELYVSPRLLVANVPIMESIITHQVKIKNLEVFKYRSYNSKDPIIATIEYPGQPSSSPAANPADTLADNLESSSPAANADSLCDTQNFEYTDFGCQHFMGISETKTQIINIVIYVKARAAKNLLTQKEITFIGADKQETKLLKWLPTKTNVIDILLVNIIGEYNLVHRTGYIEFLPEADPMIAAGSVFTELSDLRGAYSVLDKSSNILACSVCNRQSYQTPIKACSICKKVKYCGVGCQRLDYNKHKILCLAH